MQILPTSPIASLLSSPSFLFLLLKTFLESKYLSPSLSLSNPIKILTPFKLIIRLFKMMFKHLCDQTCDYLFNVTSPGAANPPPPYAASLNSPCSVMPAVPAVSAAWTLPLLSSHTVEHFFYVIFQVQPGNHQGSLARDIAVCTDMLSIPCVRSVLQCHSILLSRWLIGGLCFPCIIFYLRLNTEQRP